MNVTLHRPRTPGQRERGLHCCLIALQLDHEVVERRFASGFPPRQPPGRIAFSHHATELVRQFHSSGNVGRKSAEGLCEVLLGWRWISDQAEQERTGLPRAESFAGGQSELWRGCPRTPRRTRNQRRSVTAAKSAPWARSSRQSWLRLWQPCSQRCSR